MYSSMVLHGGKLEIEITRISSQRSEREVGEFGSVSLVVCLLLLLEQNLYRRPAIMSDVRANGILEYGQGLK